MHSVHAGIMFRCIGLYQVIEKPGYNELGYQLIKYFLGGRIIDHIPQFFRCLDLFIVPQPYGQKPRLMWGVYRPAVRPSV